jgi:hypothetical protein
MLIVTQRAGPDLRAEILEISTSPCSLSDTGLGETVVFPSLALVTYTTNVSMIEDP